MFVGPGVGAPIFALRCPAKPGITEPVAPFRPHCIALACVDSDSFSICVQPCHEWPNRSNIYFSIASEPHMKVTFCKVSLMCCIVSWFLDFNRSVHLRFR